MKEMKKNDLYAPTLFKKLYCTIAYLAIKNKSSLNLPGGWSKVSFMDWHVLPLETRRAEALAGELNLPLLVAQLLLNRGLYSAPAVEDFFSPSLLKLPPPGLMKGMDKAVARVLKAHRQKERIAVYGDYDADGITATALLVHFLRPLFPDIRYHIPHRVREGYGLSDTGLSRLKEQGVSLVITVDCGISNHEALETARNMGMDVIVTDHHQISRKGVPSAAAVLNPKQEGCAFPFKDLAGVGVAFYLVIGLRQALDQGGLFPKGKPNLKAYLDIVALGTVADVVPLLGANRILVREGLEMMARSANIGLNALKKCCGFQPEAAVSSIDLAFRLAPRLNALGRMQQADGGVQLLITEEVGEAWDLAQQMDRENSRRQSLEQLMIQEINEKWLSRPEMEEKKTLVLASENWHRGILGLVASKLVDRWGRPVFLFAIEGETAHGSGRSVEGFHLFQGLENLEPHLLRFGGHAAAAGATLKTENLPEFTRAFESLVQDRLSETALKSVLPIEAEVDFDGLVKEIFPYLPRLGPFGAQNPEPLLSTQKARVLSVRIVGQGHLRLRLEQNGNLLEGIGFGLGDLEMNTGDWIDLAYTPSISHYNGSSTFQLRIKDIKKRN
jgi:single-stranded-DNA-specific exonuclease